ncbi:unnamed protein product [Protopolystoma xenopodis]|uniref:DM14 domain-containing protein n=1 Tax=Protopolystoma xenopodis TaxID=117903 RepID=A0A448WS15_9PLAT|nr:unnamed protein product [Protopolystoma xenopodis]
MVSDSMKCELSSLVIFADRSDYDANEASFQFFFYPQKSAELSTDPSKSRRLGRIVKQYEEALQAHQKGQLFPYAELPPPPGFPPFSVQVCRPYHD